MYSANSVCEAAKKAAATIFVLGIGAFGTGHAQTIEEKAQICSACHGENGVPVKQDFPVPVIWGQNAGYLYFQLRDFKSGVRKNEQMAADRGIAGPK